MTAQDWAEVEERLKSLHSAVKLMCDGFEVTCVLERIGQFKNAIVVYVNGKIEGKWLLEDCEERARFFQPVLKSKVSLRRRAVLKKLSKELRQKYGFPDPDAKFTLYRPYWTSFKALKKHLIKHSSNIELVYEQSLVVEG